MSPTTSDSAPRSSPQFSNRPRAPAVCKFRCVCSVVMAIQYINSGHWLVAWEMEFHLKLRRRAIGRTPELSSLLAVNRRRTLLIPRLSTNHACITVRRRTGQRGGTHVNFQSQSDRFRAIPPIDAEQAVPSACETGLELVQRKRHRRGFQLFPTRQGDRCGVH